MMKDRVTVEVVGLAAKGVDARAARLGVGATWTQYGQRKVAAAMSLPQHPLAFHLFEGVRKAGQGADLAVLFRDGIISRRLHVDVHGTAENELLGTAAKHIHIACSVCRFVADHVNNAVEALRPGQLSAELIAVRAITRHDLDALQPAGGLCVVVEERKAGSSARQFARYPRADIARSSDDQDSHVCSSLR
jgi:hypothetical protein